MEKNQYPCIVSVLEASTINLDCMSLTFVFSFDFVVVVVLP